MMPMPVTESPLAAPIAAHQREASRLMRNALVVVAMGLTPALVWLTFAPLSSAVVAPAHIKVDLNRRPIQHVEGGLVREVRVRDGQKVERGQTLLVLGDVAVDADAQRLDHRVAAERITIARLEAEQALRDSIDIAPDLRSVAEREPRLKEFLAKERTLFAARRSTLSSQISLLQAQAENVSVERQALVAQITGAGESLRRQRSDLEANRNLQGGGFISAARVSQLEGTVADHIVRLEEKRAELARAEQRATEISLRTRTLQNDYRQQASDQLMASALRIADMEQDQRKSVDAARRQEITAPVSGEVMNLKFTTPGSIVGPREVIADIVPALSRLVVEATVRPGDIAQVRLEGEASIRFPAFKSATTPLVMGRVVYVAPDRVVDAATREASYSVLIEVDSQSLDRAGSPVLQAGMPAEVFITGAERTPLAYLFEPITDLLRRGARER